MRTNQVPQKHPLPRGAPGVPAGVSVGVCVCVVVVVGWGGGGWGGSLVCTDHLPCGTCMYNSGL